MVDVEQLVDPELEGLLRELGSRPRSVFLRSSRKDAMRVLRSRTTQGISPLAVSDTLERELVTAHREELAEILKQACRTKLLEGEREKLFVLPYRTSRERVDPVPLADIGRRHEKARTTVVPNSPPNTCAPMQSVSFLRDMAQVPVPELAALGQRLLPGDRWRVLTAMSELAVGSAVTALQMSRAVLDGWPHTDDALRALEIAAITRALGGDPAGALEIQDQACGLLYDYPVGHANRLRYSLLSLQVRTAMQSAARLEELLDVHHPLVEHVNETNKIRWRSGEAAPSTAVRGLAQQLQGSLGPVARRLTSALE